MTVIGLTGPSGAGKGTFAKSLPFPVLDTDRVSRSVTEKKSPCLAELVERFGKRILNPDGTLNRKVLGVIAFCNDDDLAALNRITHRYISQKVEEWLAEKRAEGQIAAVIDAPQLFESGEDALCDITVAVLGKKENRLLRIMMRDEIDEEYANARMRAQKAEEFFRERCTFCIDNDGTPEELAEKAQAFARFVLSEKAE